jgi:hypothetical protein
VQDSPLVDETKRKTPVIYRVVDGVAKCTPVRPGASDLTHRVVREGLEPGELVVVGPLNILNETIRNGQALSFEEPAADGSAELALPDEPAESDDAPAVETVGPSAAHVTAGTPAP